MQIGWPYIAIAPYLALLVPDVSKTAVFQLQLDMLQARGLGAAESSDTRSVLEQLSKFAAQASAHPASSGDLTQASLLVCGGRGAMWMPIG